VVRQGGRAAIAQDAPDRTLGVEAGILMHDTEDVFERSSGSLSCGPAGERFRGLVQQGNVRLPVSGDHAVADATQRDRESLLGARARAKERREGEQRQDVREHRELQELDLVSPTEQRFGMVPDDGDHPHTGGRHQKARERRTDVPQPKHGDADEGRDQEEQAEGVEPEDRRGDNRHHEHDRQDLEHDGRTQREVEIMSGRSGQQGDGRQHPQGVRAEPGPDERPERCAVERVERDDGEQAGAGRSD
jgi:hypothetical protein